MRSFRGKVKTTLWAAAQHCQKERRRDSLLRNTRLIRSLAKVRVLITIEICTCI